MPGGKCPKSKYGIEQEWCDEARISEVEANYDKDKISDEKSASWR